MIKLDENVHLSMKTAEKLGVKGLTVLDFISYTINDDDKVSFWKEKSHSLFYEKPTFLHNINFFLILEFFFISRIIVIIDIKFALSFFNYFLGEIIWFPI